jgi:predicted RNase H-like nuclease (RuvC/YqgF family)
MIASNYIMERVRHLHTTSEAGVGTKLGDFRASIDSLIRAVEEQQKYIKKLEERCQRIETTLLLSTGSPLAGQ